MKKLLVTGISGFLGNCLAELNPLGWKVYGFYHSNPVRHSKLISLKTDLSNQLELKKNFYKIQPDAVIHLAANSNPNYCEKNPEVSKSINVDPAIEIAKLCKEVSIPLVYSSTDLVFDGDKGPYDEEAIPEPISIYGKHKLLAEKSILNQYPKACIVRLPVMYGLPDWGSSFMTGWLKNLQQGKKVFAFTDEYRTKVSGRSAIEGILLLLDKEEQGIWHLGGRERISRFDFAVKMAVAFQLPKALIQPSLQADVQMAAARPPDVSLISNKAFDIGYNPVSIDEDLRKYSRAK